MVFLSDESVETCAGIFKQSVGPGTSRNRVVVPARHATQLGGIVSLEPILWLLKRLKVQTLKIPFQDTVPDGLGRSCNYFSQPEIFIGT